METNEVTQGTIAADSTAPAASAGGRRIWLWLLCAVVILGGAFAAGFYTFSPAPEEEEDFPDTVWNTVEETTVNDGEETRVVHNYDSLGRCILFQVYVNNNRTIWEEYSYDSEKRTAVSRFMNPETGELRTTYTNIYDEDGNLIHHQCDDMTPTGATLKYYDDTTYDKQGRMLSEHYVHKLSGGGEETSDLRYTYGEESKDGWEIVQERWETENGKRTGYTRRTETYDGNGNLQRVTATDENGKLSYYGEYEYQAFPYQDPQRKE